jgi:putative two-component system response regulator
MLRVDTDKESMEQPILLVIFHKEKQDSPVSASAVKAIPMDSTILRAMSIPIRCQCNDTLTIVSGEDALVSLSGYSVEEIESYFHRSLLEMIVPQDRTIFSSSLSASSGEDVITTAEYRLLRKNRKPVWVLGKSFVQTEENGTSHIYHTITDITLLKDREGQIESASMRNQFILEQSGSVVFEWDLVRDTMFYTDRFKEIFEYCPDSNHFTEYLSHSTHFHPDDLPLILKVVRDVDGGKHSIDINARILSNRGTYLWTRIFATALFDEQGKPTRIIGTVTDIDSMMKQNLSIKEQADRDSLTKLLNKASTQRIITSYLSQRSPEETACLLILDLDNFKAVNDSYGHMYGDALLSKVGNTLQRLFRSNDIIGRIGGDEFLILLRNLPNQKAVESRCDLVLRSFRELMSRMMPDLDGSCSIGIALIPEHGTAYSELYQHADQALYSAKLNGKNQYKIYDPLYEYELLRTGSSHITHIDSDTDQHLSEDGFVRLVFNRLYRSHNIRSTIDELLAFIGTLFNVSRVYIFENSQDNSACSNTFEWCNEGIHPQKDFLQNLTYAGDLPGWQALYDENGLFYCTDITTLSPPLRSILEPQDIKSTLQYAILDNGIFSGFIGFDECSSNRLWTQEQISLLEFLSEVISIFLIKHPPQDEDEDLEA